MVYCPYKILRLYNVRMKSTRDSINHAENVAVIQERTEKEKRLFVKLGVITGVFVAMVAPLAIAILLETITGKSSNSFATNLYTFSMALNSTLNPILFYVLDPSVRVRVDSFLESKGNSLLKSKSGNFKTQIALNNLHLKDTVKMLD